MATKLTDKASVEKIIQEMSLKEKAACITGGSSFYSRAMDKYGIPALLLLDGGTGFNTNQKFLDYLYQEYARQCEEEGNPIDEEECTGRMGGLEIVLGNSELWNNRHKLAKKALGDDNAYGCYPAGMFFGATWNPEVIEKCGEALGEEANARGVDVLLGTPNVNIHRDPLNGRLFEGYSEDPCLVSSLAPYFVKGIQDGGVLANAKHFAANNQETDRMGVDEKIPRRALEEIYFPGFKACVKAGCKTMMSAYNKINGIPCAQNKWLLQDVLRKEWGFQGFVVSDWSAAYDQVEACAAGNDLVMPGPRQQEPIIKAVENGTLSEEALDECVRNYLTLVLETPAMKGRKESFDIQKGIQAAYEAACEGITLLKNNHILPLKNDAKVSFWGKCSRETMASGAGSAAVNTSLNTNVYDSTAAIVGEENVSFEEVAEDTDVIIVTVSATGQEGADRANMDIEKEDQIALEKAIQNGKEKNIPVIVLLNVAAPVNVKNWEKEVDAVLCTYIPGMGGGQAAADILFGKVNPSGKLPITFPEKYEDCPSFGNFPGYNSEVWYGEGIYVGYRYYEKKEVPVQYPFGYGLSYTTFAVTNVSAPSEINLDQKKLRVQVSVRNTGKMAGAEVIQLYVSDVVSTLDKPVKELKAFQKVFLNVGEEKTIVLELDKEDFASYDIRLEKWVTEPGDFILQIGNSSANIFCKIPVDVQCENPYTIGSKTDIVKVVSNPEAVEVVERVTGVKLRECAGSYIVFQPLTTFADVWKECVLPAIKVDEATSGKMLAQIYDEWKTL